MMPLRFKTYFCLPLLLVLSLVTPGICGFLPEAHACCQGHTTGKLALEQLRMDSADQSCCFISSVQSSLGQPLSWLPEGKGLAATYVPSLHTSEGKVRVVDTGLLARQFLADQSDRHQLLCVWLN